MSKLLFIIGMQKSGTSLLNRMLMQQDCISNPFLPEGKFFWGDNPPFSPVDKPCGVLFQDHFGLNGHHLDGSDFRIGDRHLLNKRIEQAQVKTPILMNKNPYNSLRVSWLKALFPQCVIISIHRNPIANIYSLLKKYVTQDNPGVAPENGWWGIKPKQWSTLLSANKLIQSTQQWSMVNQEIVNNVADIDLLLNYETLCEQPNICIQQILSTCGLYQQSAQFPPCKNLNNEYLTGSQLLSKNRELNKSNNFSLNHLNEKLEFPPLNKEQINEIQRFTNPVWQQLKTKESL